MATVIDPGLGAALGGTTAKLITIETINAQAVDDIFSGAGTVYQVEIDANLNSGEDVYLKFYDSLSPTIGTTDAEMVLKGKAGQETPYEFPRGILFSTGVSVAVTTEKGGKEGTTNPTGTVDVKIHIA